MLLTLREIIDIIIVSLVVGLIFTPSFDTESLKKYSFYAFLSVGLHELAHKLVALAFGYYATIQVNLFGLLIGLVLKLMNFPIIFFVPAMVYVPYITDPIAYALIAIAGPLTNLAIALIAMYLGYEELYYLNFALFVINILPIPGFDGFKFLTGILSAI